MKDFDSVQGCPGLANTTLLFCITSPEGNFCDLIPGWETVTGYTTEELLGKNYLDWMHPDDAAASKIQTETILKGGETINFVNRLRCKNGEYKWLQWRAKTNTARSLIFSVGQESDHFMDIEEEINQKTELLQKRLKESPFLQEEHSLFKCLARLISNYLDQSITYNRAVLLSSIIGTSVDAVITINLEGTILSWNEGAEKLFGIAAKDSIGTSISRLYPKSHLSELDYIYSEVKAGRKIENFTTRRICPDGKLLDLQINISPLRNISGEIESYLSIAHDVTWMIDQQNILRESKDYLKKTQEIAKIGTAEIDLAKGTLFCSDELFKLFEKSPETYRPDLESFFSMVHPDDRETIKTAFRECQKDEAMHEIIHRLQLDSGETKVHRMFARTIFTDSGEPRSMSCIIQDITDIYSERQKRIQSETQFRMMAENVNDVIWTLDIDGKFLYVSPSVERMRGFTPEEVMKHTLQESLCPSSLSIALENIQLSVKQLQAGIKITTKTFLLEQPCKDGSTVWTEATISGTYDDTGNFLKSVWWSPDAQGNYQKKIEPENPYWESTILHQCLTTGQPVCSGDSSVAEDIIAPSDNTSKAHHYLIHPVSLDKRIRFIIGIGNKEINYDSIDEEQLRLFMEEVAKIIHKSNLVRELEITKKKAEEASQLKSSLLLNMSHELRTPLNGILGFAGLLKEAVTDESLSEMVSFIHQSGKRLMVTLTSILELAQLESSHKIMTFK